MELKIYKAHKICKSLAHGTITALTSAVRSGFCLAENSKKTALTVAFRGRKLKWLFVVVTKPCSQGVINPLFELKKQPFE